jgi:putative ABC transport system permease protein
VLRQGVLIVLSGAAVGVVLTAGISHTVANLLVGVRATDPLTFISATVLLVGIALCACYVPAHRAMEVDPMVALHYE